MSKGLFFIKIFNHSISILNILRFFFIVNRKLSHDMETTKVALENERKIQQLQMQAINALWKKVSTLQTPVPNSNIADLTAIVDGNQSAVVQDLAKTCSVLTNQVNL